VNLPNCGNDKKCVSVAGEEKKYLESKFDDEKLEIFISESYKDWEKTEV
jgi:hypothetical protein